MVKPLQESGEVLRVSPILLQQFLENAKRFLKKITV